MNKSSSEKVPATAKLEYERALEMAHLEIEGLLQRRMDIDRRLAELKGTADALSRLLGVETRPSVGRLVEAMNQVASDPGITNGVRRVLASSKTPMQPKEIRLGLESLGSDLSQYVNPGAVIHNTLTRLERQGEVARIENPVEQTVAYALVRGRKTLKEMMAAGGVPNPYGRNLAEMLKEPGGKNK
jgi:hypothetical protein